MIPAAVSLFVNRGTAMLYRPEQPLTYISIFGELFV